MGMNRKWNMKVFELHDNTPITPPNDDVYIDTTISEIIMSKYPFTREGMLPDGADPNSILEIDLADLTKDVDFLEYIKDKTNWHFKEGNEGKLNITEENDDTKIQFSSVVQAFLDLPTDSQKWVLKFDLHTNPSLYRSFFFFDGISDETQTTTRYEYGMDIPHTGFPHLEEIIYEEGEYLRNEQIENTFADEQYFTGETDMPVVVTRWNNTYTLYYDNRYMITIPADSDTLNRIGFWTWSGSNMYIKNPELFIIDSDSDATNIIIKADIASNDVTSEDGQNTSGNSSTQYSYTVQTVWDDNNNEAGLRPDSVKVTLYHIKGILMGYIIKEEENWQRNIISPRILYGVVTPDIENYTATINVVDTLVTVTMTLNPDAVGNNNSGNDNTGNDNTGNDNTGNNNTGNDNTENLENEIYSFTKYYDRDDTESVATGTFVFDRSSRYGKFYVIDSTDSEMVNKTYWMVDREPADGIIKHACYPNELSNNVLFWVAFEKVQNQEG